MTLFFCRHITHNCEHYDYGMNIIVNMAHVVMNMDFDDEFVVEDDSHFNSSIDNS